MEEMRDSSRLVEDPEALVAELATEGYVLLRGLVDHDDARRIGLEVHEVLVRHGYVTGPAGSETVHTPPPKGQEDERYWRMYSEVLGLESVNALPHRANALAEAVRAAIGPTAFTHPSKTVRLVFPEAIGGAAIPVHRDNRGGPWVRDMLTTWVALTDIDRTMGGFAVLRASHDYRYMAVTEDSDVPTGSPGLPIPPISSPEWVSTEWRPGDVVLFHCYTLHGGLQNRSDRMRLSVDYRWQSADHPVYVGALLPYHYPGHYPSIPGWDELTAHWDSQAWHRYPDNVEVTYEQWSADAGYEIPASRLVSVRDGAREAWRREVRTPLAQGIPYKLPPTYAAR